MKRDRAFFLVLGDKVASCSDLEALLSIVDKNEHLLKSGDLNEKDKMNYDAVGRLCNPVLSTLLLRNVPGLLLLINFNC